MKAGVVDAHVYHRRSNPVEHKFSYNMLLFVLDLNSSNEFSNLYPVASADRASLLKVSPKNYLLPGKDSINSKLGLLYEKWNWGAKPFKTYLITSPAIASFGFNPVNFYIGKDRKGNFFDLILEINNTFGEKHIYRVDVASAKNSDGAFFWTIQKKFHVSPFNKVEGEYALKLKESGEEFFIEINLIKDSQMFFSSFVKGKAIPFSKAGILKILLKNTPAVFLTTSRIGWQAFKLYFFKKLHVFDKPVPISDKTQCYTKPVFLQRLLTGDYLEKLQHMFSNSAKKHRRQT